MAARPILSQEHSLFFVGFSTFFSSSCADKWVERWRRQWEGRIRWRTPPPKPNFPSETPKNSEKICVNFLQSVVQIKCIKRSFSIYLKPCCNLDSSGRPMFVLWAVNFQGCSGVLTSVAWILLYVREWWLYVAQMFQSRVRFRSRRPWWKWTRLELLSFLLKSLRHFGITSTQSWANSRLLHPGGGVFDVLACRTRKPDWILTSPVEPLSVQLIISLLTINVKTWFIGQIRFNLKVTT